MSLKIGKPVADFETLKNIGELLEAAASKDPFLRNAAIIGLSKNFPNADPAKFSIQLIALPYSYHLRRIERFRCLKNF